MAALRVMRPLFAAMLGLCGCDFAQGILLEKTHSHPYNKTKWWRPKKYFPTTFVAVFSRRNAPERREQIRDAWKRADYGLEIMTFKFALCRQDGDELDEALEQENKENGDLMIMDCREGYGKGLLTKKTYAAMKEYAKHYSKKEVFMKVDDDTFVAWTRLYPYLADVWKNYSWHFYMGSMHEPGEPTRETTNQFYEPREVFPHARYPMAADGGPGYLLGGELVKTIVDKDVGSVWQLYNEDKAVAVWVDTVVQQGVPVTYKSIEGQTGYATTEHEWKGQLKWFHSGRWIGYPLLLHHRLSGHAIACLSDKEAKRDPNITIDDCFTATDNTWIPMNFRKESEWQSRKLQTKSSLKLWLQKKNAVKKRAD